MEIWKSVPEIIDYLRERNEIGGVGVMFDNLNPIFNEPLKKVKSTSLDNPLNNQAPKIKRAKRSDAGHQVKFPVTLVQQIQYKTSLKRFQYHFPDIEIQQTKYNTLLLQYALEHQHIVDWNLAYPGTSEFHMTTRLAEYRYKEIGGEYGIAMRKGLSIRKAVYIMTTSALKHIELGGFYGEIAQQIGTAKK